MKLDQKSKKKENSSSLSRAHIEIFGQVIGVFFRVWAEKEATSLGLRGFVKNTSRGTVKIVAEGERRDLEKLIELCHRGPKSAKVEKVEVEWGEAIGKFGGFEIEY